MLWLPVAMGLGIAVYFELPSEPALWVGPAAALAAIVAAFFAPSGSLARALAIGGRGGAVGLGLVAWRTASLAAPTLSRPLFSINVEGRIADIQRLPDGVRVVLEAVRLKGNGAPPAEMMPLKVRVTLEPRRATTHDWRSPAGAGQSVAAGRAGGARRLRFPACRLVPAAGRRGLCAGAGRDHRPRQAHGLRAHPRCAPSRYHRAHPESAAGTGRRRRGLAAGGRADRGRQGRRPGDARFRAWRTSSRSPVCTSCSSSAW